MITAYMVEVLEEEESGCKFWANCGVFKTVEEAMTFIGQKMKKTWHKKYRIEKMIGDAFFIYVNAEDDHDE